MDNRYFKKAEICKFTRGASRSLLLDLQKLKYWMIPHSLEDFVTFIDGKSVNTVLETFAHQTEIVDEYLEFLNQNDIVFFCSDIEELSCFPDINTEYTYPFPLSNAVIELTDKNNIEDIFTFLEGQYFSCIQFVMYSENIKEFLPDFIGFLELLPATTSQILIANGQGINMDLVKSLVDKAPKIEAVYVFNCEREIQEEVYKNSILYISNQELNTHKSCGVVSTAYFNLQPIHYTESLAHNTCLNRKIAIDAEGNIKNCPSMKESFGNIKDTTLEEAINKPGFKKYWNITKDQITKCKDCEFRHVCTDCRAYIDNPNDIYSAPLKCGYDPYTCTWEEWSTNPLKQKAIDYYGMREMLKNEK